MISIARLFRSSLTLISPELNTKVIYWFKFKKRLDLKNPRKLNEKILKLKIDRYGNDPLVKKCADKYAVREYVTEKGLEEILIPLIAVYDSVKDIKWASLPESFAMKWNFGCGFNFICEDKSKYDEKTVLKQMKKWGKEKYYLPYSEMQYKDVPHRIIVEQFLKPRNGILPEDYKFYCFNGVPKAILYISGRHTDHEIVGFFDLDWNYIGSTGKKVYEDIKDMPERPSCLEEMIRIAAKLSEGFPFVRIDLYDFDSKPLFGEMTFTPAGGFDVSECTIDGKEMGELLIS